MNYLTTKTQQLKPNNNGFTMIELLVAMSIFIILTSITAGGFINMLRNQRVIIALMSANDNMGLTIEQMAREIRTGYNFCKVSESKFQFVNSDNEVVRYGLDLGNIIRGVSASFGGSSGGFCSEVDDNWFTFKKITADNVKINKFNIGICGKNITGSVITDDCGPGGISYPPRITIGIEITSAEPGIEKLKIFTNIQTTISSRNI